MIVFLVTYTVPECHDPLGFEQRDALSQTEAVSCCMRRACICEVLIYSRPSRLHHSATMRHYPRISVVHSNGRTFLGCLGISGIALASSYFPHIPPCYDADVYDANVRSPSMSWCLVVLVRPSCHVWDTIVLFSLQGSV